MYGYDYKEDVYTIQYEEIEDGNVLDELESIAINYKDMESGVIKTYKKGRKIICYITHYNGVFTTCTGKPSDTSCISWRYDNLSDAELTANEYFNNRTRTLF